MLAAASMHLSSRNQSDTLTAHFEYPNRTAVGSAVIIIEEIKLGKQLSTLHLTVWQDGLLPQAPWITPSISRRIVLAYTIHTNLRRLSGISVTTGYEVTPITALPPLPDFEALKSDGIDDTWIESKPPQPYNLVRSLQNWHLYVPREGAMTPGVLDMWIRLANGERITQGTLAYVADSSPVNLYTFLVAPELRQALEARLNENANKAKPKRTEHEDVKEKNKPRPLLWLPTVVMNLEVKKSLPEEGVEWLATRITSKQIKDGRFDLDMLIRDVGGETVALSYHVAMILSMERNTSRRDTSNKAAL
ncbi:thioesterase-like superfamily-domain-containing protein, partial [Daldinia sp. FL1419]